MTPYRERLTAPLSWWISAVGFGVVWGWIMLVVTTWPIAIVTTVLVAAAGLALVWRYGSLSLEVDGAALRAGRATLGAEHLGDVEVLDRVSYRHRLGPGADVRGLLVTRPYVDRGVLVHVSDPTDPTPYWLLSSRRPAALAEALGRPVRQTGEAPTARETSEGAPRGEEA